MTSPTTLVILGVAFTTVGVVVVFARRLIAALPPTGIERWFTERRGWVFKEYAETKMLAIGIVSILMGLIVLVGGADQMLTGASNFVGRLVIAILSLGIFVTFILYVFRANKVI